MLMLVISLVRNQRNLYKLYMPLNHWFEAESLNLCLSVKMMLLLSGLSAY